MPKISIIVPVYKVEQHQLVYGNVSHDSYLCMCYT